MKAGTYARVSITQQADKGTSLATQLERCRAKAERMGYTVEDEFVWSDTRSGEDPESAALDSMLKAVRQRLVDAVFVYTSDRLSRDPLHLLVVVQEFQDAGVLLEFVDGKLEDTPEGRLVLYVQGYAAQKERRQIAERTMRGKEAVARSGRLPCGSGAELLGYDRDLITKLRTINEAEAQVVMMIHQWFAGGMSKHRIACRLNEMNIPTKKGCRWYPLTVGRVLTNRAYTGVQNYGEYRYRKVKGGKIEVTRRPESEVIRIEGFTPQIIDPALFELVQERLASPQAKKTRAENQYLLTGFAKCLLCGSPIVGACLNKKYRYYRCRGTTPTSVRPAVCNARYIRADDFEEFVWRRTSEILLDPDILVSEFRRHFATGGGDTGQEMAKLRREIRDLRSQQMRLLELRGRDVIDQDLLELRIGPLKALCDEKERSLRVLEEQERLQDDAADMERRIVGQCLKLAERLGNLDFEGKRAMFAALGLKVEATRDDVSITVVLDPKFTTTERTLACSSGSAYSFVIADLKEVVSWDGRKKVVEFVPC